MSLQTQQNPRPLFPASKLPPDQLGRALLQLAWLMLITNIVAILFCGWFPFNFGEQLGGYVEMFHRRFHWDLGYPPDVLENIEFFIPYGFALGAVFAGRKGMTVKKWLIWFIPTLIAGFIMTCTVELSQVMLTSRYASEAQILCNTSGAIIGYALFGLCGWLVMPFIAVPYVLLRRAIDAPVLAMAGVVWLAAAAALPFIARNANSLDDWHSDYRLSVGNEVGGHHEFNGRVASLLIADRSVSDAEAARLFAAEDFPTVVGKQSVVADYRLRGPGPYPDESRTLGPLTWVNGPPASLAELQPRPKIIRGPWARNFFGVPTSADHWLESADPAVPAVQRIRRNQAFTLMVDFVTDLPGLTNIAPIASMSGGSYLRNITVLEDQPKLYVRVNTPQTGGNGTDPEYQINDVFGDDSPHRVLVTYQRPVLRIYVDGTSSRFISTLLPETMLVNHLYPREWRYPIGQSGRELMPYVYRILVFVPLGLLIAGATATLRQRRLVALLIGLGIAIVLDAELQHFAGVGFSIHRLAAAIILCAATAALAPAPRRWLAPASLVSSP
jgi:glycopeptide antibiotics resistance protein